MLRFYEQPECFSSRQYFNLSLNISGRFTLCLNLTAGIEKKIQPVVKMSLLYNKIWFNTSVIFYHNSSILILYILTPSETQENLYTEFLCKYDA